MMLSLIAVCIPQISYGVVPYGQVSTNRFAVTNVAASSGAQYNSNPLGSKLRVLRAWWEVKDYVRYGVPYLLENNRRIVICCGLLVVGLGGVVANSAVRGKRVRKQSVGSRRETAAEKCQACLSATERENTL